MAERRPSRGGRDIVDHSPNGHDDIANAAAGVIFHLMERVPLSNGTGLAGPEIIYGDEYASW